MHYYNYFLTARLHCPTAVAAVNFVCRFFTIVLASLSLAMGADNGWTPDLRVAIFPLEPLSPDNTYDTYPMEKLNESSSSSALSPADQQHRANYRQHYQRHNRHEQQHHHHHFYHHHYQLTRNLHNGTTAAADEDGNDLFCSLDENRAEWTTFGNWSECTDSCGGCGSRHKTRKCRQRHSRCECHGVEREEEACNLEVCIYPRKACCSGRRHTSMDGKFACERIGTG